MKFNKNFSFRRKKERADTEPVVPGYHNDAEASSSSNSVHDRNPSMGQAQPGPANAQRLSSFPPPDHRASLVKVRSNENPGPLGLSVVYTPNNGHKVDIVFVHGLGGTSHHTWSKYKNPNLFWPLTFLPLEPDICLARILTFGYNANIHKAGNFGISILDFAKGLLFDLKYAKDDQKEDLDMGKVPLLFVVHSMGGLIVKEAYIQGQNDPEYQAIIKSITAITFLATPHRGTNLAEALHRILQSTFVTNSKQYITELSKNSFTLQKLNEQFRHIAPRLDIVSFYETQRTPIAFKQTTVMVLEKDSSVLGYPGEISKGIDADHHGICKYESQEDPNYINVRNALKSLISKIIMAKRPEASSSSASVRRSSVDLRSLLAITEMPDTDYIFFRDQWAQGTSTWILEARKYQNWIEKEDPKPRLLWLYGGPATGKSVLASYIINSLAEQQLSPFYFFLRFGDRHKRTLSLLLRTIAHQIALRNPDFAQRVIELAEEAIDFQSADTSTIWERIFKSILFKMPDDQPSYWIIDGIDEADNPRAILRQLSHISTSKIPIRILIVSRRTSDIVSAVQKVSSTMHVDELSIEGHEEDMRCYIRQELRISDDEQYQEDIMQRLINGAQNNFLWIRLAVEKLNQCRTSDDVETTFGELPVGMGHLYDRMITEIMKHPLERDITLARSILQCVVCSLRVLTVAELTQACSEDLSRLLDLQRYIVDICCGFVVIDNGGNISMVHQTAREYLLNVDVCPHPVHFEEAHEQIFLSCMKTLMTVGARNKVSKGQIPIFLDYAASWWSLHLVSTPVDSALVISTLHQFLSGQWVLRWIEYLAGRKQLRVLVQTAKNFLKVWDRRQEYCLTFEAKTDQSVAFSNIRLWAIDMVKIVAKFGETLRRNPESIYKLIPPFCPQGSAIYQQFGKAESRSLDVSGLSAIDWDDSLARLSTGLNTYTSSIACAGTQISILTSSGNVSIYDSVTFEEKSTSPICHGESVYCMVLNSTGTLLATYGYRTTRVWDIVTGEAKVMVPNVESKPRPLAMLFMNNNTRLIVGTDDRRVRQLDLTVYTPAWTMLAELDEPELEGLFLNSANYMALNGDGSLVAVAYRGHPTAAWELDGPSHIDHCWLNGSEKTCAGEVIDACWHPNSPELLGLYLEGVVFKWRPYEDSVDELPVTGVSRLQISKDGNLFATGDVHGTVKIYATSDFRTIYCLASEDPVLGLAFSPSSRRFFDIRGYYGNAWQPDALMRFAEQTDKGINNEIDSDSSNPTTVTTKSSYYWVDTVTVVAGSPIGRLYCYGTEKGTVQLHDVQERRRDVIWTTKSHLSIERMAWSESGHLLAFSDSSNTVIIFAMSSEQSPTVPLATVEAQVPLRDIAGGHIQQLLFSMSSQSLLVIRHSTICRLSLSNHEVTESLTIDTKGFKYIIHPQNSSLYIGIGTTSIMVIDCDLQLVGAYTFVEPLLGSPTGSVDRVVISADKKLILTQTTTEKQNARERHIAYFPLSSLVGAKRPEGGTSQASPSMKISLVALPAELTTQVAQVMSFLSNYRLVFLSRNFSVCSCQLPLKSRGPTRSDDGTGRKKELPTQMRSLRQPSEACESITLFTLPGDWISRECLALCGVWSIENSFLCPRSGEVAVVKSAALI